MGTNIQWDGWLCGEPHVPCYYSFKHHATPRGTIQQAICSSDTGRVWIWCNGWHCKMVIFEFLISLCWYVSWGVPWYGTSDISGIWCACLQPLKLCGSLLGSLTGPMYCSKIIITSPPFTHQQPHPQNTSLLSFTPRSLFYVPTLLLLHALCACFQLSKYKIQNTNCNCDFSCKQPTTKKTNHHPLHQHMTVFTSQAQQYS